MLWGVCSGDEIFSGDWGVALGSLLWGGKLLWGLGSCSGEFALGMKFARGTGELLWGVYSGDEIFSGEAMLL